MSDENAWKWEKFVDIGRNISKMSGLFRVERAKDAIAIIQNLRQTGFLLESMERFLLYEELFPHIAAYLDGDADVIESSVSEYFFAQHCKAGFDAFHFDINFFPKLNGVQSGFACQTHQNGPTADNPKSMGPPDAKELFIYKLLQKIGIGPEVHLIVPYHGTRMTIFIATKDCKLVLPSKLTAETALVEALVQLDLISRILCLYDCTTNTSNCGQVDGKPMIIDFRIESQDNYFKPNIVTMFYEGNIEFNYTGLMGQAVALAQDEKFKIMKKSLESWNLMENLDLIDAEMDQWIQFVTAKAKIKLTNDLQKYVQGVKQTIQIIDQHLESQQ